MKTKRLGLLASAFLATAMWRGESLAAASKPPTARGPEQVPITVQGTVQVSVNDDFQRGRARETAELVTVSGRRFVLESGGVLVGTLERGATVSITGRRVGDRITVDSARVVRHRVAPQGTKRTLSTDNRNVLVVASYFTGGTGVAQVTSQGLMSTVASFYNEVSYTYVSMSYAATTPLNLGALGSQHCDDASVINAANSAATAAGWNPTGGSYTNVIYVFDGQCSLAAGGVARGQLGGGTSWFTGADFSPYSIAHELGHNFGLNHSTTLSCGSAQLAASGCTVGAEYGDGLDVMSTVFTNLNAANKDYLNWFPAAAKTSVTSGRALVQLSPYETATGSPIVLRVQGNTGPSVYFEWRQSSGIDTGITGNPADGALVHENSAMPRSHWLDMVPEGSSNNNFSNASLVPGLTFACPVYGLNVTAVSRTTVLTLLVNVKSTAWDAPLNLDAHQTAATTVSLSWSAPASGTPQAYEVQRTENPGGSWTALTPTTTGTSFSDTTGTVGHTYAYRIHAKYSGVWSNNYSDIDPATLFTDPTTGGSASPLVNALVKSVHLSELQTAATMRHLLTAGSSTVSWQPVPVGNPIQAANIQQVRDALDEVLGAGTYTDTMATGLRIKAQHIFELRERVK